MVYIHFPANLTEEEEWLQKKYAKLRKKRKSIAALKAPKPETHQQQQRQAQTDRKRQSSECAEDAKEQAKKLVKSGAIRLQSGKKDSHGFKRSKKNFERKLADEEKSAAAASFQPFSANYSDDIDEQKDDPSEATKPPKIKNLYESFVSTRDISFEPTEVKEHTRPPDVFRGHRDRAQDTPKKGNTVYVYGHGISEELLKKAFSNFGTIRNITMEMEKNVGFVTFDAMKSAEQAIIEMNGSMLSGVQLKVTLSRRQPAFEVTPDPSSLTWSTIAASNSQKGTHKDKREIITYDDDDIF